MMEINYAGGRPFEYKQANAMDGSDGPYDKTDEQHTDEAETCVHFKSHKTVALSNSTRCAAFQYSDITVYYSWWLDATANPYCADYSDQTNCSDKKAVRV